jgi:hypothetical protein
MKNKALERFTRNLLSLFGRTEPERACLDETTLAALAGGERLPGRIRRRALRHAARCPVCLEKLLLLREITGEAGTPLFQPGLARFRRSPAWRPLASAAVLVLVAGLLYLGGITLQRLSTKQVADFSRVPAAPPVAQTAPAAAPEAAPPSSEGQSGPPVSKAASSGGNAPARTGAVRLPQPDAVAPAAPVRQETFPPVSSAVEGARTNGFAPEPAPIRAAAPADRDKDQPVREREREEADLKSKAAAPAPVPAAAAPAEERRAAPAEEKQAAPGMRYADESAGRLAAKKEQAKGAETDLTARLDALCQAAAPRDPEVYWRGRSFRLIRGELVQDGVCEALGRRPVERTSAEETARLRRSAGYDQGWRAVWLLTPDAIRLVE